MKETTIEAFLKKPDVIKEMLFEGNKYEAQEMPPLPPIAKVNFKVKVFQKDFQSGLLFGFFAPEMKPISIWSFSFREFEGIKIAKSEYAVLPEFRRKGICKLMFLAASTSLAAGMIKGQGQFDEIQADIEPKNIASIKFVEKVGFQIKESYNHGSKEYLIYSLDAQQVINGILGFIHKLGQ